MNNDSLIRRIKMYQQCAFVHPLTCGNDSNHRVLEPVEWKGKVVLLCPDCDYLQENFPDVGMVAPMMQHMELMSELKCPEGYDIPDWDLILADSLTFGCDWLDRFLQQTNPACAFAVEKMAKELSALKYGGSLQKEFDWTDEDPGRCAHCHQPYEMVRPGKSQPTCNCHLRCPECGGLQSYHATANPRWPNALGYFCDKCGPHPGVPE